MQAQATRGIWELLFWIFTGSGLFGLPPGERDAALIKAVPPQTVAYFEWVARGPGKPGAAGVDGFAADPEIQQFFELLDAALANRAGTAEFVEGDESDLLPEIRTLSPQLLKLMTAHPGCGFVGLEPPPNNPNLPMFVRMLSGVHAGVILSSGDDTEQLWQSLNQLLSTLPDFQFDPNSATQTIPIPIPGYTLLAHREGSHVLLALGDGTLPRILDGLAGRQPGLDTNPRFQKSLARVTVPRLATVGWVDGAGILNGVITALGPVGTLMRPLLNMTGVDALDHIVQTTGVDQDTMVQRTFIATGGRTDGIMVLTAGEALKPHHFAHVPGDADLVLATSLNLTRVFQESRQILSRVQPISVRVFDEAVKQLESELQLRIVEDVLPAFGDTIVAFDSPAAGGMIATSLVVSLEVKNPQKAAVVFDRLMNLIEQSLVSDHAEYDYGTTVTLRQQTFLGQTLYFVNTAGGGFRGRVSITPTFCLLDRHLLFAVHPQAMKAHLRHSQSKRPGFDQEMGRKINLQAGETLSYGYLNGPRASSTMSSLLPYLGDVLLRRLEIEGVVLDAFSLPSAAAIAPYFGDSTAVITRQPDGLMFESHNAPPVQVGLALVSAYRSWHAQEFEVLGELRRRAAGADGAVLGPAEGEVVPAAAEKKVDEKAANKPAGRGLGPIFLRALIPEGLQQAIPQDALRALEEGPTPEMIQRREEARRMREERRQRRQRPSP
ncbi:hypothetical protein [Schlesneria sp. DSM 10557]|uniref:hypothetical protein n=1 Tax=Schlesneria sp. DSM 10557 TaxID=3044399 RepID=UPI0035A167A7